MHIIPRKGLLANPGNAEIKELSIIDNASKIVVLPQPLFPKNIATFFCESNTTSCSSSPKTRIFLIFKDSIRISSLHYCYADKSKKIFSEIVFFVRLQPMISDFQCKYIAKHFEVLSANVLLHHIV